MPTTTENLYNEPEDNNEEVKNSTNEEENTETKKPIANTSEGLGLTSAD